MNNVKMNEIMVTMFNSIKEFGLNINNELVNMIEIAK